MTLANLKAVCAAYHKKTIDELTQNGVDLFLVAANNARRNAELRHNFEFARVLASLDIAVPLGGSLADATVSESSGYGTFVGIREVVAVTRESSAGYQLPVDFTRADMALERERTILDQDSDCWPVNRYPSDADLLRRGGYGGVVQRGSRLFIYPAPQDSANGPVSVVLQGYGWLADYLATDLVPTGTIVTGTLTPNAIGTFTFVGVGDNTYNTYARFGADPYISYISGGFWRIARMGGSTNALWTGPAATASPVGSYIAGSGATGTATVALSAASSPDFFLLYGASYLQWEIIIELNYYFKSFVPRQEGNLASPEKQRDASWNAFLEWDSYQVDSNVTKYRG